MMLPIHHLTDINFIDTNLDKFTKLFPNKPLNNRLGFVVEEWDKHVVRNAGFHIEYEHLQTFDPYDYGLFLPNKLPIIADVKCSFYGSTTHTIPDSEINAYKEELKISDGIQVILRSYSQTFSDNTYHYTCNGTFSMNTLWKAGRINPGFPGTWKVHLPDLRGHEFEI